MDAANRIALEYDRLIAIGRDALSSRPMAERFVYYVVSVRCEIDINGFSSVYEQYLSADELLLLADGLTRLNEPTLTLEFRRGYDLLNAEGFYQHLNWNLISESAKNQIKEIGELVGDQLWNLDEKLVDLLAKHGESTNGNSPSTAH